MLLLFSLYRPGVVAYLIAILEVLVLDSDLRRWRKGERVHPEVLQDHGASYLKTCMLWCGDLISTKVSRVNLLSEPI
jgi:hypothetical protein